MYQIMCTYFNALNMYNTLWSSKFSLKKKLPLYDSQDAL